MRVYVPTHLKGRTKNGVQQADYEVLVKVAARNPLSPYCAREITVWLRPACDRKSGYGMACKSDFYRCGLDISSPAAAYANASYATLRTLLMYSVGQINKVPG